MEDGDTLTIKEAAAFLRFNQQTIYALARKGKIPCSRVHRKWRFCRVALAKYAQSGRAIVDEAAAIRKAHLRYACS